METSAQLLLYSPNGVSEEKNYVNYEENKVILILKNLYHILKCIFRHKRHFFKIFILIICNEVLSCYGGYILQKSSLIKNGIFRFYE